MSAEKAYPVAWMCKQFKVSRSGYYAWVERPAPARSRRDAQLSVMVAAVHSESRGTYGSGSIRDHLVEDGEAVGRKRVARLMRDQGLSGNPVKKFKRTTDSTHGRPVAKNLVKRNFTADGPNQLWVADISYVWTWEGFIYLAVIVDVFSRRVVGWAIDDHMRAELALEALAMAVRERRPPPDLVHHSDRGSQAIRERGVPAGAKSSRDDMQHESQGRLLGQCDGREFLRHVEARAHLPTVVGKQGAGDLGDQ